MSGMAGVLRLDGAPVSGELLSAMEAELASRGPDARRLWVHSCIGFVHTLLRATDEARHEEQPASLDGQVWITADARIDGRQDLARELGLPAAALARPDHELILHAYAKWGEACVEHLLGDFAFAIWDARARKLFCARDHFGVKPFFYAQTTAALAFSNSLNCVRVHPDVSDDLNDLAIADFLLVGANQNPATTTFRDVQRLPAAHVLIAAGGRVSVRRYWTLPCGERLRYSRSVDYVEKFGELFGAAIADRLRTEHAAIFMSGGLDSSSVAAFARRVAPETRLHAYTYVYDSLLPDQERHYAGIVADALPVPITFIATDDVQLFAEAVAQQDAEPVHNAFYSTRFSVDGVVPPSSRVILTGDGADVLFCLSSLNTWPAIRAVPMLDTAVGFLKYSTEMRRVPRFRLRSTWLNLVRRTTPPSPPTLPAWIDPDFARRCDLQRHLEALHAVAPSSGPRPLARRHLNSIECSKFFSRGEQRCPRESRYPFLDVRLVRYLLAIPELPYSMDKYLLRTALKGYLPEVVRTRPKTPLAGNPLTATIEKFGFPKGFRSHRRLAGFVCPEWAETIVKNRAANTLWSDSRPASLASWFQSQEERCTHKTIRIPLFASPMRSPISATTESLAN